MQFLQVAAIIWLAYEAARMLTGEQYTLRMALIWLLLVSLSFWLLPPF